MKNKKTILAIRDFIMTAEKSLKNAKKLLKDLSEENWIELDTNISFDTKWLHSYKDSENKIVEWVFTGESMIDSEWNTYPIPANYSSKSKLVQWDKMKLTIDETGRMTYKQIAQIERETKVGLLVKENWKYSVVCDWEVYDVLTAAVTHFKWEIWDNISVILPAWKRASFAAIEAVIPKEK